MRNAVFYKDGRIIKFITAVPAAGTDNDIKNHSEKFQAAFSSSTDETTNAIRVAV